MKHYIVLIVFALTLFGCSESSKEKTKQDIEDAKLALMEAKEEVREELNQEIKEIENEIEQASDLGIKKDLALAKRKLNRELRKLEKASVDNWDEIKREINQAADEVEEELEAIKEEINDMADEIKDQLK